MSATYDPILFLTLCAGALIVLGLGLLIVAGFAVKVMDRLATAAENLAKASGRLERLGDGILREARAATDRYNEVKTPIIGTYENTAIIKEQLKEAG